MQARVSGLGHAEASETGVSRKRNQQHESDSSAQWATLCLKNVITTVSHGSNMLARLYNCLFSDERLFVCLTGLLVCSLDWFAGLFVCLFDWSDCANGCWFVR